MKRIYTYQFYDDGMLRMQDVLKLFRYGFRTIGDLEVERISDNIREPEHHAVTGTLEYLLAGGTTVTIRTIEEGQKLEVCISTADVDDKAGESEARIRKDIERIIYMGNGMEYCCE